MRFFTPAECVRSRWSANTVNGIDFLNSRGSPPEESRTGRRVGFRIKDGTNSADLLPGAYAGWRGRVVRRRVYSPNRHRRASQLSTSDIVDRNPVVSCYRTPLTTHPDLHVLAADDKTTPFSPIDDPRAQSIRISEPRPLGPRPERARSTPIGRTNDDMNGGLDNSSLFRRHAKSAMNVHRTGRDRLVRRPAKLAVQPTGA